MSANSQKAVCGKCRKNPCECGIEQLPNSLSDCCAAQQEAVDTQNAEGHLMDYVLDLHIITGPNGMCRCGEGGITCSERLRRVSHEIASALLGAHMAKSTSDTPRN